MGSLLYTIKRVGSFTGFMLVKAGTMTGQPMAIPESTSRCLLEYKEYIFSTNIGLKFFSRIVSDLDLSG